MFGLNNYGGSCWLNACIQSLLRLPEVKSRYTSVETDMTLNSVDKSLSKIWKSSGKDGLKDLFDAISETNKSESGSKPAYEMLAGKSVGDSNEAFVYLCDKLPFLDLLCRYNFVERLECQCGFQQERADSHVQFQLYPSKDSSLIQCISDVVKKETLDSWKCDKCSERGKATKEIVMKTFPKVLTFKLFSNEKVTYSDILVINSHRYQLHGITAFNGGHWWAFARDPSWVLYDDTRVRQLQRNEVPSSQNAKMLIYYRIN
jgi:ubiquitin C-terminal hydrolase